MRTLSSEVVAAINSKVLRVCQFIEMHLPPESGPDTDGVLYLNTTAWTINWNGHAWLPVYGIGSIEAINDQGSELTALKFTLSGVYVAALALVLTTQVQGRPVYIRTAIFNEALQVMDAPIEWAGRLNTKNVTDQNGQSVIEVTAEHFGIDGVRPSNLRMSQQDQTRAYPGDNFFDKLIATADKEIVWPAASFKG